MLWEYWSKTVGITILLYTGNMLEQEISELLRYSIFIKRSIFYKSTILNMHTLNERCKYLGEIDV